MHLTHLFSLFTYWKNVTLCLSSLLIMMNWSSSHSLTSHSSSSFSYSPDAMSDNVPILSSFNSYHPASSIVLYIYDAHVYLLLRSTFQNLSLSWTYRKRKKTKKREFFLLFLFRWIFHPLQSKNENHHHQHVIITYSYTFSSSIYTYIICSKKNEERKRENEGRTWHLNWNRTLCIKQDVASHIKWWSKWIVKKQTKITEYMRMRQTKRPICSITNDETIHIQKKYYTKISGK